MAIVDPSYEHPKKLSEFPPISCRFSSYFSGPAQGRCSNIHDASAESDQRVLIFRAWPRAVGFDEQV
jgi:hypothetical protein